MEIKFDNKELYLLKILVRSQKEVEKFKRGFRKMTKHDKEKDKFYDDLHDKLNVLGVFTWKSK